MLHLVSTIGFMGVAFAMTALVWAMLADRMEVIALALGIEPKMSTRTVARRRVRVTAVRPATMVPAAARRHAA